MSAVTIKAATIDVLEALPDIGLVESRKGRIEGLPWEGGYIKPLWEVSLVGSKLAPGVQSSASNKCFERTLRITGYMPHNFDSDTESAWDVFITSTLPDAFVSGSAINGCAKNSVLELLDNDFVTYKAKSGAVLCHYAVLEIRAQEWVNTLGGS
jgi:hypothetical protein